LAEKTESKEDTSRRLIREAKEDFVRMAGQATSDPQFCGTIRIELGIKDGIASYWRSFPDRTHK
jgi:hypothetical protein